jgi:hypothetical protein
MKTRLLLALSGFLGLFALLTATAGAQAVVQAYQTDSTLQVGMIIQLAAGNTSKIQAATQGASDKIHGVVVAANDAPFALSGANDSRQAYAATSGDYRVLVSDQNGTIQKDDYIVVSSLDGIGMKVDTTETYVLGKARESFDGKTNVQGQTSIKDAGGGSHTVHFGYVQVGVDIARNPMYQAEKSNVPDFLQKLTDSVANKPVSAIRIYIGMGILLATALIVFSLLYSGVRTSMVSLGRNPLAKKSIVRNLFEVVLIGLIVLISGLFGVYLLLKL